MRESLSDAEPGDLLVLQNETSAQAEAAQIGRELRLSVCYAAAPFDAEAVRAVLPYLSFLILNEIEAQQLEAATGYSPEQLGVSKIIVTKGSEGASYFDAELNERRDFAAYEVTAVDTTGAGDTFTGYVLSGIDRGMIMQDAIDLAMRAAALMVTRPWNRRRNPGLVRSQRR